MTIIGFLFRLSLILFLANSCQFNSGNGTQSTEKYGGFKGNERFNNIVGTWVSFGKEGFTLIEIKDTSDITYFAYLDKYYKYPSENLGDYWYYNSKAKLGFYDNSQFNGQSDIWIETSKFRFDYKIIGDTLMEIDKMGIQGKYLKVTSEQ